MDWHLSSEYMNHITEPCPASASSAFAVFFPSGIYNADALSLFYSALFSANILVLNAFLPSEHDHFIFGCVVGYIGCTLVTFILHNR